jgi:Bacterial Ig domain
MNVTRTARWIGLLFAALFFFAAYPVYSAVLSQDTYISSKAPIAQPLLLPTLGPLDPIINPKVEANDDQVTTLESTAVTIDVLANDEGVDPETGSVTLLVTPQNGSATVESGLLVTYTPASGFTGEDSFEYEACNDKADNPGGGIGLEKNCDTATVSIIVDPTPVANAQPYAADDIFSVGQGTPLSPAAPGVLANDFDPNGDALTAVLAGGVENGSLEFNADGSFSYNPAEGFIGVDDFTYQADDGEYLSNLGTVEIEVIDTEPPTVHWLSPGEDGEVFDVGYEMVHLEVVATDNGTIEKVHFFRWDAQNEVFVDIAEVTEPPYAVEFHSSVLNYEWNQILARVYDSAGNVSERIFIWIYLNENVMKVYLPSVLR